MVRIVFHHGEIVVVAEHGEAGGDDVGKVHLHRHDRAEAPEDPDDDLRQVVHASNMGAVRGGGGSCFGLSYSLGRASGCAAGVWDFVVPHLMRRDVLDSNHPLIVIPAVAKRRAGT